jgi:enamine deaminase RidA (YjgF/YER057c/UK114 family)
MSSQNKTFNPPGMEPWSPAYRHISRVPISAEADLISFAGQIGRGPGSNDVASSFAEQVSAALANVDVLLQHVGATKQDIVQVRQYVVNLLPQDPARVKLYMEWIGDARPPSTLLGVQALADKRMLYEIEVVCVVRK